MEETIQEENSSIPPQTIIKQSKLSVIFLTG